MKKNKPEKYEFYCRGCRKKIRVPVDYEEVSSAAGELKKRGWRIVSGISLCPKCLKKREDIFRPENTESVLSGEEKRFLSLIADRAYLNGRMEKDRARKILTACNFYAYRLDFQKLLNFNDTQFNYDISLIDRNLDIETGLLNNFFIPLSAAGRTKGDLL